MGITNTLWLIVFSFLLAGGQLLFKRAALGIVVEEIEDISAGGMPDRVKCLHSLVAHSLAAGHGVNPLGDEALAQLPKWWLDDPCTLDEPDTLGKP